MKAEFWEEMHAPLRFGQLRRLPPEYVGERHLAIAKQLPSDTLGREWYEFEERPGPGPELHFGDTAGTSITVLLVSPDQQGAAVE